MASRKKGAPADPATLINRLEDRPENQADGSSTEKRCQRVLADGAFDLVRCLVGILADGVACLLCTLGSGVGSFAKLLLSPIRDPRGLGLRARRGVFTEETVLEP